MTTAELFPCAKCGAEKPRHAFEALGTKRIRSDAACIDCKKKRDAEFYQRNKVKRQADGKARYERNKEKIAIQGRAYREKNRDRKSAADKAYHEANRDKILARAKLYREEHKAETERGKRICYQRKKAEYNATNKAWKDANRDKTRLALREWKKRNPHKVSIDRADRRAAFKFATPAWIDLEKVREVYAAADLLSMVTGDWHHVDHVVPLRAPLLQGFAGNLIPRRSFVGPFFRIVQGLHVHTNLCVLDGPANSKKGNRYWPDMP